MGSRAIRWKAVSLGRLLVGVSVLVCGQRVGYGQSGRTIEEVGQAWKARQERTRSGRFKWRETRFIPAHTVPPPRDGKNWPPKDDHDFLPENDLTLQRSAALSFQGNMMRYSYEGQTFNASKGGLRLKRYVSVFDAEVSKNFHGLQDRKEGEEFPLSGFIRKKQLHWDYDNDFISALLVAYRPCDPDMGGVDLAGYRVDSKLGNIGGHSCLIVRPRSSQGSDNSYWVDPARGFLVLRIVRAGLGPLPLSTLDISYRQDEKHGWVPSGWKFVRTGGTRNRVFEQATVDISEYEINVDIPKSEFQFEFPPGTAVTDSRTGTRYIARDGGVQRVVTKEELARGATYRDLVATETGEAGRQTGRRIPWLWCGLGLLPAAVIVVLVVVRVRRRSR